MNLSLVNKHWKEGFHYAIPFKRTLYHDLCRGLDKKYILSLVGLRRVGKTTLLKQLIDFLIEEKKVSRQNILYYTFDEPAEWDEVLNDYLTQSSADIDSTPLYFFLDEVQKLADWQNKIKIYYDHYPHLKFIVSGSSSLFIRKKAESLAGRIQEFTLAPLSFAEFIAFKGKSALLAKPGLFPEELQRELEIYASQQFIEIIGEPAEARSEYLNSLLRKVIFEDIPQIYPIEQPHVLWKMFKIIAAHPGMLLDYHSLSSDLGIHEKTLANYSEFLEKAFLIKKLYNFSRNLLTSEKKLRKVYPIASSFCEAELPLRIESLVVTQLPCTFFWRKTLEVDCILTEKEQLIPVEIKYKEAIKDKDFQGLRQFMGTFNCKEGIILTKNLEKPGKIRSYPVWKFLLGNTSLF